MYARVARYFQIGRKYNRIGIARHRGPKGMGQGAVKPSEPMELRLYPRGFHGVSGTFSRWPVQRASMKSRSLRRFR